MHGGRGERRLGARRRTHTPTPNYARSVPPDTLSLHEAPFSFALCSPGQEDGQQ